MPLINCKECNASVSDVADKCPHCGAQVRELKRTLFGKAVKVIFVVFNIFMCFGFIKSCAVGSGHIGNAASEAERTGAALGTAIASGGVITFWAAGAIILGLAVYFTRPK